MLVDFIQSDAGTAALIGLAAIGPAFLTFIVIRAHPAPVEDDEDQARRIARNSAIPIASQFVVRGVDLLVAIAILRLLGPTGNGQYAIAVVIWLYAKTISDFGLGLFTTREISRDPERIGELVGGTTLFRLLVLLVVAVPLGAYAAARTSAGSMADESAIAVALLLLSIIPSSYAEAVNSALNGLERMDLAAWINIAVNIARAPLAVLLGASTLGVSGVALAALAGALLSAIAYFGVLRRVTSQQARWWPGASEFRRYARESWPLLVNALLISLFFRIDVFVVEAVRGAEEVGLYDAAYKIVNLLTIIPAYAVLAVFPLMSRRAGQDRELARAHQMTTYLLVTLAWIAVVGISATSELAIRALAGDAYLPEAALLLRILIWFAPLSFANGVFQYVLVADGRQRVIVPAFLAAVVFNLIGNLALVPLFGAQAAAALTVATELVIFAAFAYLSRGSEVRIHAGYIMTRIWRPSIAGAGAAAVALTLHESTLLAVSASAVTFVVLAIVLRVVTEDEIDLARRVIGNQAGSPEVA